ncbi:nose resistant to fluoxetine protein 6-like isoform X2 [Homalodisca vitripennis]|uniref:nose resistant to fluoxetine protein 6-like isoform X2 n=1 Tax=Homalodisca vitripennis TaxID=197043 RepID=UPI001EEA376C|nr:nose resistant to fluoxetine protein 6-like isoform X2 [Homalodisca vitripennis]XP_046666119.1 nose resistant to fluoxetine protein 6-like isoform X2 [Homalodisca vitripennis]
MTSTVHDPGHRLPKFSLVHWGVCVPSVCSPGDVQEALRHVLGLRSEITTTVGVDPDLCHHDADPPTVPSLATISAWGFFIAVGLLCLLGTITELRKTCNKEKKYVGPSMFQQVVDAFCVRRNVRRLLDTTGAQGEVSALNGVRALNAMALLLSHKQMALLFLPFVNRTQLAQLIGRSWSMVGRAASLYTDSFILLSGLLTALSLLRELSRSNRINLVDFVLNRLIRLTPSLAALVVFCTFVLPGLGSGPLWGLLVSKYATLCQQHWWRNLLFIHNYYPFDQMCLTHSHQVAIDMQLYLTAPLLVFPLWWRPRLGLPLLLGVAVWSSLLRYSVVLSEQLSTIVYFGIPLSQLFRTAQKTYILPSHRATVYCLGVVLGYIIHCQHSVPLSRVTAAAGWVVSVACGLLAIFAPYHMSWPGYVYDVQEAALYNMLAPVSWSIFVGWVIFSSHYGCAGWFGRLLTWRWFVVFTRLSYAVYLTQFPIFFYNVGQARVAQQYSIFRLLDLPEYIAVLLASAVLTVMFDLPAQNLKKAFLSSSKDAAINTQNEEEKKTMGKMVDSSPEKIAKKRLPG